MEQCAEHMTKVAHLQEFGAQGKVETCPQTEIDKR